MSDMAIELSKTKNTTLPPKNLFRYPTDTDPPAEGLNFYWRWGIKHFEEEMLVAELMTDGLENVLDDAQLLYPARRPQ